MVAEPTNTVVLDIAMRVHKRRHRMAVHFRKLGKLRFFRHDRRRLVYWEADHV
jgi:hypothetical protein